MPKIITMSRPTLLPFPETKLPGGEQYIARITSAPATGRFRGMCLLISEECRPHVRIKVHDVTSGKFVSADLVERLELHEILQEGQTLEIEVQATKGCLFVGALKGMQSYDPGPFR